MGGVLVGVSGRGLRLVRCPLTRRPAGRLVRSKAKRVEARRQLRQYFRGRLRRFDLRLDLQGTPFQVAVGRALVEISYGAAVSYGELAPALERRIRERMKKRLLAIRLENWQIARAKEIARKKGVPYQRLMREWISRGIRSESRTAPPSRRKKVAP